MKILKAMSQVTGHRNIKEFSNTIGLTSTETIAQVNGLVKMGFVKKKGSGYAITEKGKQALKAIEPVAIGKEFKFYIRLDQPTNLCAATVKDFYEVIKKVDTTSINFHFSRGDFENWIRTAVNDANFADELLKIKKTGLKDEELREAILKAIRQHYSIDTLM
ncbi:MAG: DUF5752 family protein [Candidatus Bathyarchaeota archaeon]|nr:DUF5752 family protein [Candidatus Bathyarchaeota archaeon]